MLRGRIESASDGAEADTAPLAFRDRSGIKAASHRHQVMPPTDPISPVFSVATIAHTRIGSKWTLAGARRAALGDLVVFLGNAGKRGYAQMRLIEASIPISQSFTGPFRRRPVTLPAVQCAEANRSGVRISPQRVFCRRHMRLGFQMKLGRLG